MKRVISILLSVLVLMSCVIVSAVAGTTDGNCITIDGTDYYVNVGDVITYYSYLNVSECTTNGKIGSIDCEVEYTSDVLEFVVALDEYGDVNKKEMYPILGTVTVANYEIEDCIKFNFSSTDGVRFNTDESVLCKLTFKVIAQGSGVINNKIKVMAKADSAVTKIVFGYEKLEEFYMEQAAQGNTGVEPTQPPTEETQESTQESTDAPATDDEVAPVMIGDVDNDGKITIFDVTELQRYLAKYFQLDERAMIAADTDKDNKISIFDATTIQLYLAKYITEF